MKNILISLTLLAITTSSFAANKPVYTSAYTDLARDCKWQYAEKDLQEGQDNALICKGNGVYELLIDFSAEDALLSVRKVGSSDYALSPSIKMADYKKGKIEWRLVNGQPFAIIVRAPLDAGKPALAVRGLLGFEAINAVVSNNKKAREAADNFHKSIPPVSNTNH